ncbi:hypothetical protein MGYG_02175 [Nannizzia gypsea CBS 118893]|uniref:Uncharacterized protein n=1 Tax=Arthroderma gypseum (strain ATCC MYA-4604 / CBS 118893) TaxID=535722 RepID=E4UQ82_ARTGP|nr:hypothetical protein MGYG_02175 [Nannizzia gypsea CBS 118893]EFQ99163.1 hypothetical protein MGYG_02175 [Nannizzia gypsea CBS 118893]
MGSVTSNLSDPSSGRGHSRRHKRSRRKGGRRRRSDGNTDTALDMLIQVFVEYMKIEIENAKIRLSQAKESRSKREKPDSPVKTPKGRGYGDPMPIDSFEKADNLNEPGYRHSSDSDNHFDVQHRHGVLGRGS